MNGIVQHFVSGHALFTGAGALLVVAGFSLCKPASGVRWMRSAAGLAVVVIAFSAAPLPWTLYALWAVAFLFWLAARWRQTESLPRRRTTAVALMLLSLIAIGVEAPWHITPAVAAGPFKTVCVIGDSVSSGIGVETRNWPGVFAERSGVRMVDLSHGGDTVASALYGTARAPGRDVLFILEIGGNDLLGHTGAAKFEAGLDELLRTLQRPGCATVMLELPLPPFCNRFGRVQRRLARRYGVVLLPKRHFTGILAPEEYTVDGIHLTQAGHDAMADMLLDHLRSALQADDASAGTPL